MQLASIGCPIKGDLKYGDEESNEDGSICLHAKQLSFIHPVKKEMVTFDAPLPSMGLWKYFFEIGSWINIPRVSWIEKLRQKWNLGSPFQVVIILIVFACTGFTVFFIKRPLLQILAGHQGDTILASILYYILILPLYNVLLLAYGFLFGQFNFFWDFEKRFFKRLSTSFRKNKK